MAIAFDAAGGTGNGSSGVTSLTWSHTCTGSNLILLVGVVGNLESQSDVLSSVTYIKGGVTTNLTQISDYNDGTAGNRYIYLYYMLSPDTGSNTVTLNNSTSGFLAGFSVSYTGAKQSGQPDNSANQTLGSTTQSTWSQSLTPNAANSWIIAYVMQYVNPTISAGSGTTLRTASNNLGFFDSNAGESSATTLNYSSGISTSRWEGIIFSIAPVAAAVSTVAPISFRSLLGVGI